MINRPRRLRFDENIRSLARETRLSSDSLILPIFLQEGKNIKEPITSMDNQFRYSADRVDEIIEEALNANVKKVILFGIPDNKDEIGSSAYDPDSVICQGIRRIKEKYKEMYVIADVCMCEYTSHGHCGIIDNGYVQNDETLDYLAKIALVYANSNVDMIAPSDMMDGRILKLRNALDENSYHNLPIMSYAVKYSSAFYGPFREAAGSAPAFSDRKNYQMDYHNSKEALKEAMIDINEGADILMVKPALSYLDIIYKVSQLTNLPLCAYSVSGEYAMIKAAAKMNLIDEYKVMCESAVSIYRAGANILISYYANEIANAIKKGDIG